MYKYIYIYMYISIHKVQGEGFVPVAELTG